MMTVLEVHKERDEWDWRKWKFFWHSEQIYWILFLCHWNQNFSGYINKSKRIFNKLSDLISSCLIYCKILCVHIGICKSSMSAYSYLTWMLIRISKGFHFKLRKKINFLRYYVASYISHQFSQYAFKDDLVQSSKCRSLIVVRWVLLSQTFLINDALRSIKILQIETS